jgi:hypothetical protein
MSVEEIEDFREYICQNCGKSKDEHVGSWERSPYMFFCSIECHDKKLDELYGKKQSNFTKRLISLMKLVMRRGK